MTGIKSKLGRIPTCLSESAHAHTLPRTPSTLTKVVCVVVVVVGLTALCSLRSLPEL